MDYFKHRQKMQSVRESEGVGQVADSMEVRLALMERFSISSAV